MTACAFLKQIGHLFPIIVIHNPLCTRKRNPKPALSPVYATLHGKARQLRMFRMFSKPMILKSLFYQNLQVHQAKGNPFFALDSILTQFFFIHFTSACPVLKHGDTSMKLHENLTSIHNVVPTKPPQHVENEKKQPTTS